MKINVWWGFALLILCLIALSYIQFRQKQYLGRDVSAPTSLATPTPISLPNSYDLRSTFLSEFASSVNIQYYVIHDPSNQERNENIQRQETKLGKPIHRFDAIMGKDLDLDHLSVFDPRLQNKYNNRNKNEYGCYLSHFMLITTLSKQSSTLDHGYTVIFEDDFQIMTDDLESKIQHAWSIIDTPVDMLFLGHLDHYIGPPYKENLFEVDLQNTQDFSGTHGYVLRNQSIPHILECLYVIDNPIDYKFGQLFHDGQLHALLMNPTVVDQTPKIESTIGKNR
jgi:GR25 family glycosyltransferase involved in LPS biosynthesis